MTGTEKTIMRASDLKILGPDVERVRTMPGVYIGGKDGEALKAYLREPIDNVFDVGGGYLGVEINTKTNTFIVQDRGGGIDIAKASNGMPALTAVFTILHAGTKLEGGGHANSATRGIHGVGVSITNFLSETFEVWTYRKVWYYQKFQKGIPVTEIVKANPPVKASHGTVLRFTPDYTIFDKSARIDIPLFLKSCEINSYLTGFEIDITVDGEAYSYHNPDGLRGYANAIAEETYGSDFEAVTQLDINEPDMAISVSFAETGLSEVRYYVNGVPTPKGGTHAKGFVNGIYQALASQVDKKDIKFTPSVCDAGFFGAVNVRLKKPTFRSQTKE